MRALLFRCHTFCVTPAARCEMGPRKKGLNRSKSSQKETNKQKQTRSLKNKVRDVQRLLKKSDLPATVRVVQERMLDVLKESIKDKAKEDKEKKISKRSKKVKFFEKRKIFRKYKACMRELLDSEDNSQNNLQKELEEIKQQWNYVVYFPEDTKYISLFPLTRYTSEKVREKQEQIMEMISDKVASGELEDASATIDQMGSGSAATPKLRLTEKDDQAEQKDESEDENEEQGPPEDDFFINTSPTAETSKGKGELKKKKKKSVNKLKRSKFFPSIHPV